MLQWLGYLCHTTKTRLTVFARCSAQRRQDIIGNRRRKSARAQRDIFGSAVKSRIVGAVMQKVKKKKTCLDHLLKAELTHSAGFCASQQQRWPRVILGLIDDAPDVTKHHLCPWNSDFFCFVVPLWAFYVTQTDLRWSKAAGCFASRPVLPRRGGGQRCPHRSGTL